MNLFSMNLFVHRKAFSFSKEWEKIIPLFSSYHGEIFMMKRADYA